MILVVIIGWCIFLCHFADLKNQIMGIRSFCIHYLQDVIDSILGLLHSLFSSVSKLWGNLNNVWVKKPISRGSVVQFCYLNTHIHAIWDSLGYQGHWCLASTHAISGRPQGHLWAPGSQGRHPVVYPLVISQAAESHTKNGIQALDSAA